MSLPSMQFPITARLEERETDGGRTAEYGICEPPKYDAVLYVGSYEFFRCPADEYSAGFGRTERGVPIGDTLADALREAMKGKP